MHASTTALTQSPQLAMYVAVWPLQSESTKIRKESREGDNSAEYIRHRSWQVRISSTHEQALKAPFCDAHSAKSLLEQPKHQNYKNEKRQCMPQSQILVELES